MHVLDPRLSTGRAEPVAAPEAPPRVRRGRFEIAFDPSPDALLDAFRLRSLCFMQANPLSPRTFGATHVDVDLFDRHCTHVVVSDLAEPAQPVVGHVRMLDRRGALRSGGFRTQRHYAIDRILAAPGRIAEVGRVCTHPEYRQGRVMDALFAGIYAYLVWYRIDLVFGMANLWSDDTAAVRAAVAALLTRHRMAPSLRMDVLPTEHRLPPASLSSVQLEVPPLVASYLSWGVCIADEPVMDDELGGYAIGILLQTHQLSEHAQRHYVRALGGDRPC